MRLQRLDISGFKSFSERAQLAFDNGVTAIVGPNGCGKSNLSDAITWVLGEQSAKSLRGDRMEDVIFNGSEARKPTAAAEVRATFSDVVVRSADPPSNGNGQPADGEPLQTRDVEITRRLYRSGESEYLIDGAICRLRDIHELLMDTGLGAKAYAIIEQGKIGMILSARPTDRRQLIEEAAGVTKYRARRRAAELKLEAALQNLARVDDVIFELDKQLNSLKRQAAKARRYRRIREELREWETVAFARKHARLADVHAAVRQRLTAARADEEGAAAALASAESDLGRLRLELAEFEGAATHAREAVHAHELEMGRRQQQIELDQQEGRHVEARVAELDGEIAMLARRRDPEGARLQERRTALEAAGRERDTAGESLQVAEREQRETARRIEGLEADVEAGRTEVFAALNSATALRHAVEHAVASRERVSEQLSRLQLEYDEVTREVEAITSARTEVSTALDRARQAAEDTARQRAAGEAVQARDRAEQERLTRLQRASERELDTLSARLESLEALESARAGYSEAATRLLESDRVQHAGAVADCMEAAPRYERAIEACLGDLLQYVIVADRERAEVALRETEGAAGRCGLLVVQADSPPPGEAASAATPSPDGAVPVASVLHVTEVLPGVEAALCRAIGPAWIAETLEAAQRLAPMVDGPVATLAGEVVRGRHVIVGGPRPDAHGVLSIRREIKDLQQRQASAREAVAERGAVLRRLQSELEHHERTAGESSRRQHDQEKEIVALEIGCQRATEDEDRLRQKLALVETERESAREELQRLESRQTEASESIARLELTQRQADERLAVAQRRLMDARAGLETLTGKVVDVKASHAALVERATAIEEEVARLEVAARELETRAGNCRADRERLLARGTALAAAVRENTARLDEAVATLDGRQRAVREAEGHVEDRRGVVEERETMVRQARSALEAVRSRVAALDLERATAESDLTHLERACADALQMTLEAVVEHVRRQEAAGAIVTPSWYRPDGGPGEVDGADGEDGDDVTADGSDELERAAPPATPPAVGATPEPETIIAALREKLDRLGAVNMMAVEQFDELSTRHEFLTTQRQDLQESIASTDETIKRIDETTRQRLRDAFEAINANFQETFSTLFGGGRAGLTLIDESNILETGIEIVAQPPGKRLQNVQLLSGGEKAMTAIALMFSIFQYKPSPFCVLDEIDAPLDDANIGRFVEMLKGMLSHTQFILITHNRKTMEIANRLYGVTMEEPGVSKLISVELN